MSYINLLPQKEQERLLRERRFRMIVILGTLVTSLTIVFTLTLMVMKTQASYFLLQKETELIAAKVQLNQAHILEKKISSIDTLLSNVGRFYQSQISSPEVEKLITGYLEPGMKVKSFYFSPQSGKGLLVGYSPDLDTLERYREKLNRDNHLLKAEVEITGLFQTKNINFRLNFSWQNERKK